MLTKKYSIPELPLSLDVETIGILKQLNAASRALAELKGVVKIIPNEHILIATLGLQEAKDSSAVENIITTNDELFRYEIELSAKNKAAKEVLNYKRALLVGYELVKQEQLLTNRTIKAIQAELEKNNAGFRKLPGTALKNNLGEVVYEPPQNPQDIIDLMSNLERYINDNQIDNLDPLIKMAIIHCQFESIHPFYDGNGRTGRIMNILYLVKEELLDIPILYLSHYIIQNKTQYYKKLNGVNTSNDWESWIIYMLKAIEVTAYDTVKIVNEIRIMMDAFKQKMKVETSFYRKELLEILFQHPYTKISFLEQVLQIHRNTAAAYLNQLVKIGLLTKIKIGKHNYYVNQPLFDLFAK